MHRGIDLGMPQQLLHLFHGHAFVNGDSGEVSAEFVWMDAGNVEASAQFAQTNFNTADLEAAMGLLERDKQRRVLIPALFQVVSKVNLRPGIEVGLALFASLAKNDALPVVKVDIRPVRCTSSPTRIPVEASRSMIARSRRVSQPSRMISSASSE